MNKSCTGIRAPGASRHVCLVLMVATGVSAPAWSQTIPITHERVTPNIFLVRGAVGNITVLTGPDGVLLVDSGVDQRANDVSAEVASLSDQPVEFLINTHWHYDHRGGNGALGARALRISHHGTRELLETMRVQFGNEYPPLPESALPNLSYSDSMLLRVNGERVRIFHLQDGHTRGDTVVYFENANVLSTGDLFFKDRLPMIDLAAGGTFRGYVRNVAALIAAMPEDVRVVPGHGDVATLEDFRRFHAMLQQAGDIVGGRIAKGETLGQIRAAGTLDQFVDWKWMNDFITPDRFVLIIYSSLTGQPVELFEQ